MKQPKTHGQQFDSLVWDLEKISPHLRPLIGEYWLASVKKSSIMPEKAAYHLMCAALEIVK